MKRVRIAIVSLAALVATGCGANAVPRSPEPTLWPSANLTAVHGTDSRLCTANVPTPSTTSRSDLPDTPAGADLLWFPGMNAGTSSEHGFCRTLHTHIDGDQARALVAGIKALPAPPAGPINCPMDDGRFVQLWFATPRGDITFRMALSGCAFDVPHDVGDLGSWPPEMGTAPRP